MIIGVPRETKAEEHRVGLLPSGAYQLIQRGHDSFQLGALTPEGLCFLRGIPNGGVFELALDFSQALTLARVVKGTPSVRRCAL